MPDEVTIVKEETSENPVVMTADKPIGETVENKTESPAQADNTPAADETYNPDNMQSSRNAAADAAPADNADANPADTADNDPADTTSQPKTSRDKKIHHKKKEADTMDDSDIFDFDEDEPPKKHSLFRSRSHDNDFLRDQLILSRVKDEDLIQYLTLEQQRLELLQQAKERKEKRFFSAFQLTISLAAIVAVTYLLKDNPTILISILYIVGIIAALHIWKNPRDKDNGKKPFSNNL